MNDHTMEQALTSIETRVKNLEEAQLELNRTGTELRVVLGGDLTGKPGVLQNQVRMINALFDEKEGIVPRLTAMERRELERMGWLKGVYFAWCILGAIIGYLISHFIIK